jgi:DUF1009 family protein
MICVEKAARVMQKRKIYIRVLGGNLKERAHLEDLVLDKEILKLILKMLSENVWNRLVWLRIWLEFVKVIKNLRILTNEGKLFP